MGFNWLCPIGLPCALLLASASGVLADTLPSATYTVGCVSGQLGPVAGDPSCSQTDANGGNNLTLTLSPFAGLSASANVAADVVDSFGAIGALHYSFEVVGGNPGDQVPLLIFTNLFSSETGNGYGFAEIGVNTGLTILSDAYCTDTQQCAAANFSGTIGATATSGVINQLYLEVEASAGSRPQSGESATALADPLVYVDPSLAGAANYSILVSQGVGNGVSDTPEPDTLLLACFGVFALFVTRRYLGIASRYPTGNCRPVGENLEILALGRSGPACPQKGYETNET